MATKYPFFNTKHPVIILRVSLFAVTPSHVASSKIECQNFSYVYRSRKHWECKYYSVWISCLISLSPRNALRWGYSNAAVVPSVSPSVVPSVRGPCEHNRDYTVAYFFVKLGRHFNHDKRMNPIDFGGQRSKVKVTMDIYGNKLVNTIETTPLRVSLSNLVDMLTMIRG